MLMTNNCTSCLLMGEVLLRTGTRIPWLQMKMFYTSHTRKRMLYLLHSRMRILLRMLKTMLCSGYGDADEDTQYILKVVLMK